LRRVVEDNRKSAAREKACGALLSREEYSIMDDLSKARLQMVQHQIAARGIRNPALLDVMRKVPREFFVPPHLAEFAYLDTPLPIESGQTISQPYIVALMIESLQPRPGDRALEIGTGSGYAAAVLAQLVSEVYTVERDEQTTMSTRRWLRRRGDDMVA
jgi:protein-L-isoaspartate(D-aspartate) O-methyltransferase